MDSAITLYKKTVKSLTEKERRFLCRQQGTGRFFNYSILAKTAGHNPESAIGKIGIRLVNHGAGISRADNLPAAQQLFHTVGAPSHRTSQGEQGVYSSTGISSMLYTNPL